MSRTMVNLYCKYCWASFNRQAILAMLIDLGVKTSSSPSYCHDSPDKLHDFVSKEKLQGEDDE